MPENETPAENLTNEAENQPTNVTLVFEKGKMVGNATYKNVKTEVTVTDGSLNIVKYTKKAFRKVTKEVRSFNYSDITSASLHTAFDFWDGLYAVITAILGIFINPLLFIFTAACIFTGYGKKIKLSINTGEKYEIPLTPYGSKENAEQLIKFIELNKG